MKWVATKIYNFFCMFVAGYHQEMRDFYNKNLCYNPIKVTFHEMRM